MFYHKFLLMTVSNRMFGMVFLVALLYVSTIYMLTSSSSARALLPWHVPENERRGDGHEEDSHKDLRMTDEIIIILGYKLHSDGMATRILRDRVEAAAILYKNLMSMKHHPLIIVSGKGKSEIGYTEAEVMLEWSVYMGVRKDDILIDPESTNTVQNAKFSAELIRNRTGIDQVYVVTSDYHILRAQYIFQSVFPSSVKLDFASSKTPDDKLEGSLQAERVLMKSSKDDLINEHLLDTEPNGTHPISNYPLWQMISREIETDVREGVTSHDDDEVIVADYTGAADYTNDDPSYFSTKFAENFYNGEVVSIERPTTGTTRGANNNTHIRHCTTSESTTTGNITIFSELQRLGVVYTYQMCPKMFDWFPANASRAEFEATLAALLLNARTTFIELPETKVFRARDGISKWDLLNRWYAGRNETQLLRDVATAHAFQLRHKLLGPSFPPSSPSSTLHKVLRVDVVGLSPRYAHADAAAAYMCV